MKTHTTFHIIFYDVKNSCQIRLHGYMYCDFSISSNMYIYPSKSRFHCMTYGYNNVNVISLTYSEHPRGICC